MKATPFSLSHPSVSQFQLLQPVYQKEYLIFESACKPQVSSCHTIGVALKYGTFHHSFKGYLTDILCWLPSDLHWFNEWR